MAPTGLRLAPFVLACLTPAAGIAQAPTTGTLQGRVNDRDGVAVAAATVRVSRSERGFAREATTDLNGRYRILFLPPGDYQVSVRRIGYRPTITEPVVVAAGTVTVLTIAIEAAARTLDSIVVRSPAVTIERQETEFGTRIGEHELSLLPKPNLARNLVAFANGARPDQVWGGATAQANNYQLDGVSINHPGVGGDLVQPAVSWIEEIQVRGLGAGAEQGNFQGGIVNVVTKSGTNRVQGGLAISGESERFNGSNLVDTEVGSEQKDRFEVDGQVRGPIRRDRLFYAVFGQIIARNVRVVDHIPAGFGAGLSAQGPRETERRLLGKLTWQPTARDALIFSVANFGLTTDRFGETGFQSAAATQDARRSSWLGNLSWQRALSTRSFLELKLAGYDGTDDRNPPAGPDVPGLEMVNQVDPWAFQNPVFRERQAPRTLTATASWDVVARFAGLEHHLRIGGEQAAARYRFDRSRNGGLTWRPAERFEPPYFDPNSPATWRFNGVITSTWGGEVHLDSKVENSAVWIQDYIQLTSRLSFNPGVRWGRWVGRLADPTGAYFTPVKDAAFEPRFGLAYALVPDGSFMAKAHWGRYHQSLFASLFDRAAPATVYSDEERWEYLGQPFADPTTRFTVAQRTALAAAGQFRLVERTELTQTGPVVDYRQPYIDQAVLSLEKTFGGRWKAEVLYLRRRNRNMVALVDRNLASNYTVYDSMTVLDRFNRPFYLNGNKVILPRIAVSNADLLRIRAQCSRGEILGEVCSLGGLSPEQIGALSYDPDYVLTNVPDAERRFDQVQLKLESRHPTWWAELGVAITWLEGNLNTIVGADDYSGSSAGPYVLKNESFESFGRLNNQSNVELKLRLGGNLPAGFRGGLFGSYASGDYYTPYLTLSNLLYQFQRDVPAGQRPPRLESYFFDGTTGQRIFLLPRGSLRYGSRLTVDVHLERSFPLGRRELLVRLDGFNVLGESAITDVQASYNGLTDPRPTSFFNAVRARVAPRTLRFGTGIQF